MHIRVWCTDLFDMKGDRSCTSGTSLRVRRIYSIFSLVIVTCKAGGKHVYIEFANEAAGRPIGTLR